MQICFYFYCNNPNNVEYCPEYSPENLDGACGVFHASPVWSDQLKVWSASVSWNSMYSGGNSVQLISRKWENHLTELWTWTFLISFLLEEICFCFRLQRYCHIASCFSKLRGRPRVIITESGCFNHLSIKLVKELVKRICVDSLMC